MGAGHLVESGDQRDQPLAGLERADVGDQGPVDGNAQCPEHGAVGALRGLARGEPFMVNPVWRHHHRCPHIAHGAQPILCHLADADQHRGPPRGAADGAPEEGRLGAEVPFGMVEERAVVDRHRAGHRRPVRHGVVRTVVHLDPGRAQHGTEPDLLVDEPARPRGGDDAAQRGATGQAVPARLVTGHVRRVSPTSSRPPRPCASAMV